MIGASFNASVRTLRFRSGSYSADTMPARGRGELPNSGGTIQKDEKDAGRIGDSAAGAPLKAASAPNLRRRKARVAPGFSLLLVQVEPVYFTQLRALFEYSIW
jgi:hypothetical protein